MFWRKGRKVVCLGLDGTPYSLLTHLIDRGVMPNTKSIVERGTLVESTSSIPEISSVAWTTIFTGKNPAEHGIFGFVDLVPNSYRIRFPSFHDVKAPALWERLTEQKRRSIVVNVPATYPAKPLYGRLVAGFVAIDLKKACWPVEWADELERRGYIIDIEVGDYEGRLGAMIEALHESLEIRSRVILDLFDREKFDLFWAVITETDRLHHFMFDAAYDESHPLHSGFVELYARIDRLVGELAKRMGSRTSFFAFSDHGFCRLKREVNINAWLQQNGYLEFERTPPESLEDIAHGSRAFALDPARIFVNLKGKFPKGSVERGDRDRLVDELAGKLISIADEDGEPVIARVFRREEIYDGPLADRACDLVLIARPGYDLKGRIRADSVFLRSHFTGMHTRHDAFFLSAQPMRLDEPFGIAQIYGILAEELGL
ncbi:MAG TPA: hypothetical protein ENF73_06210 [Proteobacteria bacterium]|nr:hypothetical protein [Pseudomonadota bacterium]